MLKCDKHFQGDVCDSGDEENTYCPLSWVLIHARVMASSDNESPGRVYGEDKH